MCSFSIFFNAIHRGKLTGLFRPVIFGPLQVRSHTGPYRPRDCNKPVTGFERAVTGQLLSTGP